MACKSFETVAASGFAGLTSRAKVVAPGNSSRASSSRFGPTSTFQLVTPVRLPPGRFRLAPRPNWDRVTPGREYDRNRRGRRFGRQCRRRGGRGDDGDLVLNQLGRQRRQSVILAPGPAILDRHVAALDITSFVEALAERGHHGCVSLRRPTIEEPDHRHCWLLRARRERPDCRRTAAEKRDEFPPPHGAYPKAKDHGLSIAGSGAVHRSKSGPLELWH